MNEHDQYPSRNGSLPAMLERLDPVVYARDWSSAPLSRNQIQQYDRDGFLILDNLISADNISECQREVERLRTDPALRTDLATITEQGSDEVRSIFRVHQSSPVFAALIHNPRLQQVARFLLDDDIYIHQSRVNYKPGLRGNEFYWHSDFETWHVEDGMPRMRALSMSITLTENFAWNGSLLLIPGSHRCYVSCSGVTPPDHFKSSLQKQELGVPDDDSLQELASRGGIVPATGKPGSVIVFDCNTMHGSNGNITPFPRSNVFFVFNAVSNRVGSCLAISRRARITSAPAIDPVSHLLQLGGFSFFGWPAFLIACCTSGGMFFSSCLANALSACTASGDVDNQANQMNLSTTEISSEKQLASLSYRASMLD